MIRESIARHGGGADAIVRPAPESGYASTSAAFQRLPLLRGGDDDGNCIIEPAVRCNHCGYCQSFGH